MSKKFYITTAIPYVNASPHLGHTLEFIQTDVIARYQKVRGQEVALVTGADENSLKNVQAAESKGMTTQELCDQNAAIFKKMANEIGLIFTSFRRTSNKEKHWSGVKTLWELCNKSGDIYKKKYKGLYCVGCEAFYEEKELPDGVCPEHRKKPEVVEEENYFFKLSKYQDKLEELIERDLLKILPQSRKNEVLSFIRGGLKDFSVSRSVKRAKNWGVPVPDDPEQIMYVWFDALGTYLTGIGYGINEEEFKESWPADVHVIGKGILRFHAIYWPAILLSAGLKLPKSIFVHGYITVENQKMSKTLGNIIDPFYLVTKYGVDQLRYCLMSEVPTFDDGDFSEKILVEKNNNELIANLGNLVNRTLVFLKNNFEGKVPKAKQNKQDEEFLETQQKVIGEVTEALDNMKIKEGIDLAMVFAKNTNRYFQDNKPWELAKTDKQRAGTVLQILVNQVKDVAILIEPYLPHTSNEIFKQLNIEKRLWEDLGKLSVKQGHSIGQPKIIFTKLEYKKQEKEVAFEVTKKAADLGIKAAAAIVDVNKISNKSAKLEKLKKQKFELDDKGYVELHKKVSAEENTSNKWLYEMTEKNGEIPNINTLVDSYNFVSLKTGISAGAHDVSKLTGNVRIDVCRGDEKYTELGAKDSITMKKGQYGAIDEEKVICRLELKQCEQTKVTKNTKRILLYYQGVGDHTQEQANKALVEACELIKQTCGGNYKVIYPKKEKIEFKDLDLEVGEIVSIERHPDSEKLYIEKVKLKDEEIQLVSGLVPYYKKQELLGKKVIVVKNLMPAKFRGAVSQGMLLAAETPGDIVEVIECNDCNVGDKVNIDGVKGKPKQQITIKEFAKIKLEIKDYHALAQGKQMVVDDKKIKTKKIKNGKIR